MKIRVLLNPRKTLLLKKPRTESAKVSIRQLSRISSTIILFVLLLSRRVELMIFLDGLAQSTIRAYIPSALLNRAPKDYYLLSYNVATLLMWSYLLLLLTAHLRTPLPSSSFFDPAPAATNTGDTASETLGAFIKGLFGSFKNVRTSTTGFKVMQGKQPKGFDKVIHYFASFIDNLHARSKVTYTSRGIGVYTLLIQSIALLEVVHSALGFVRSPLQTTGMQVASRLLVVWWFVESEASARTSGWYASMIGAWSIAEILRSSYYLAALLHLLPPRADAHRATKVVLDTLTYLRYSAFYVLYPLGAGSEWMIMLKGFPSYPSKAATVAGSAGWKILKSGAEARGWVVAFERFKYWIASFNAQAWLRVPFVFIWPASTCPIPSFPGIILIKPLQVSTFS